MKLPELQKYLSEKSIELALFFGHDPNITYFAGAKLESGCLAVPVSGNPLLFVPGFEADRLAKSAFCEVVRTDGNFLTSVCKVFPAKRIGIVFGSVSYAHAQTVKKLWKSELAGIEGVCRDLRVVKSSEEIAKITKACAITDVLFEELCASLPFFVTELDAASFLKNRISQLGFEPSFPPIIASGTNGAIPHHVPTHSKLSGFTVIDFGIVYKNYCSDITRTVFVGRPSAKDREIYDNLLKVQTSCIKKVSPGTSLEDIDAFAHKLVGKSLIHGVGHSLGIDVHDVQPRPFVLQQGNVITIEPGTYHAGRFGIRIEDDVLVTEEGPIVLTKSLKDFIAVSSKL